MKTMFLLFASAVFFTLPSINAEDEGASITLRTKRDVENILVSPRVLSKARHVSVWLDKIPEQQSEALINTIKKHTNVVSVTMYEVGPRSPLNSFVDFHRPMNLTLVRLGAVSGAAWDKINVHTLEICQSDAITEEVISSILKNPALKKLIIIRVRDIDHISLKKIQSSSVSQLVISTPEGDFEWHRVP